MRTRNLSRTDLSFHFWARIVDGSNFSIPNVSGDQQTAVVITGYRRHLDLLSMGASLPKRRGSEPSAALGVPHFFPTTQGFASSLLNVREPCGLLPGAQDCIRAP